MIEHVEIHLDGWGKHGLTFVYSLMQFATIYTFCIFYYQYYTHTCNPSVYRIEEQNVFVNMLGLKYDLGLQINVVLAILSKFASIVLLSLALDEYQNLNSNGTYLIFSIYCCLAPTCLLIPIYTYDHVKCIPKNFVINNSTAQIQCIFFTIVFLIPFVFGLLIPKTWTNMVCCLCKKRKAQKVEAIQEGEQKEQVATKKRSTTQTLSLVMVYFINLVSVLISIGFIAMQLIVHSFQYRLMDGELINSGGINEAFSFVFLLVISIMHYQKEVTQNDIQKKMEKFEEALSRRSVKSSKSAPV